MMMWVLLFGLATAETNTALPRCFVYLSEGILMLGHCERHDEYVIVYDEYGQPLFIEMIEEVYLTNGVIHLHPVRYHFGIVVEK